MEQEALEGRRGKRRMGGRQGEERGLREGGKEGEEEREGLGRKADSLHVVLVIKS